VRLIGSAIGSSKERLFRRDAETHALPNPPDLRLGTD
jgi:hypothetical protein